MGQYYQPLIEQDGKRVAYSLQFKSNVKNKADGSSEIIDYSYYTGIKLMEHSWWGNLAVLAVAKMLYKHKGKLAWVGDYADDFEWEEDLGHPDPKWLHRLAWEGPRQKDLEGNPDIIDFTLDNKYLVNHKGKSYIDLNEYRKSCEDENGWCVNPLPILTACGNGLGGGDYHGACEDEVGLWCWIEISIEDEPPKGYTKDDGFFFQE